MAVGQGDLEAAGCGTENEGDCLTPETLLKSGPSCDLESGQSLQNYSKVPARFNAKPSQLRAWMSELPSNTHCMSSGFQSWQPYRMSAQLLLSHTEW